MSVIIYPYFAGNVLHWVVHQITCSILSHKNIFSIMSISGDIILNAICTIIWNWSRNSFGCFNWNAEIVKSIRDIPESFLSPSVNIFSLKGSCRSFESFSLPCSTPKVNAFL